KMRIATAENVARDNQESLLDSAGHKLAAAASRGFWEDVERAAGFNDLVLVCQAVVDQVALPPVVADVMVHRHIHGHRAGPLHRLRCANERVLLDLGD